MHIVRESVSCEELSSYTERVREQRIGIWIRLQRNGQIPPREHRSRVLILRRGEVGYAG